MKVWKVEPNSPEYKSRRVVDFFILNPMFWEITRGGILVGSVGWVSGSRLRRSTFT